MAQVSATSAEASEETSTNVRPISENHEQDSFSHSSSLVWLLKCPDLSEQDELWRRALPFSLWDIGERPLLAFWLDYAVDEGVKEVVIEAIDRPHMIREYLAQGNYWSIPIKVVPQFSSDHTGQTFLLDRLPGMSEGVEVGARNTITGVDLVSCYRSMHEYWLEQLENEKVPLYRKHVSGGWIAKGVTIHPAAVLTPPFWIGEYTDVQDDAIVGPNAVVGGHCVLEPDSEVRESLVCPRTWVGSHVEVKDKIVEGGVVIDLAKGIRVEVGEAYVLSSLQEVKGAVSITERVAAFIFYLLGSFLSLAGEGKLTSILVKSAGKDVTVTTAENGSLLVRRRKWLLSVMAGELRLRGPLPRSHEQWDQLPQEVKSLFENQLAGVFSLSDSYDIHDTVGDEELLHAIYQQSHPKSFSFREMLKVAFTK